MQSDYGSHGKYLQVLFIETIYTVQLSCYTETKMLMAHIHLVVGVIIKVSLLVFWFNLSFVTE